LGAFSDACASRRLAYIERVRLPREVPVMTLPEATLFPQALLPLYIFEPRYRQMLADALNSHRMFSVAMQKPDTARETPLSIAGLGLIRVSVGHKDGTSHLILQGLTRVELEETVRVKPYRVARVRPIATPPCDTVAADALLAKVRELLKEWLELGVPFPFPFLPHRKSAEPPNSNLSPKEILGYLDSIRDPESATDLISCAVLKSAPERQAILEAVDVETRLRRLVKFLLVEVRRKREEEGHG
jgi:ATP-dependent Lon protease